MLDQKIKVLRKLTIGPQVSSEELSLLAHKGCQTIVNLSQKGECDQLLKPIQEQEVVEELGMDYFHFPLSLRKLKVEEIDEICRTLSELEGPVYLHCRIGQRSALLGLLYLALRQGITYKTMLKRADKFGISFQIPYLQNLAAKYIEKRRPLREEILAC